MIYLKRKSMKKYVVVYKRKKYIKVATSYMPVVFLYCDKCQNYTGIYRKHTARGEDCEDRWKHLLPNIERWYHVPTRG